MQIHLQALGCRLNEAELESWAKEFRQKGHEITDTVKQADVVVLNTCAVTQQAVRSSRQSIRRLHKTNPLAKMVVSGCYVSLEPDEADELGVDLVVNNKEKEKLVDIAHNELSLPIMPKAALEPDGAALFALGRQRAFIKVQDGCRYRCTFCIVTVARGDERSRSIDDIVNEINQLSKQGVKEAVIAGVHVGGYGSDNGSSLYELVEAILARTDIPRLRFASVEPWDLPEHFFTLFENPRLMPHMHLPLQSGSDSVLRKMARRCKTSEFTALVEKARRVVPDFNVTTDIIVGFPGETDDDWQNTLTQVEALQFGHIHIFSYSPRAGTKAASLPHPVPGDIKKQRSQALHALAATTKQAVLSHYIGRQFEVLWEGDGQPTDDGFIEYTGYTPNYLRVSLMASPQMALNNEISRVNITAVHENGDKLVAELA